MALLPFRAAAWISVRNPSNTFYLFNNLAGMVILLVAGWLNTRQKNALASEIFIFVSCYLCFTAYPFQNPDQVLLYLVIPVSISSLISDGRRSILVALVVIPIFLVLYQVEFANSPLPIFSVICVLLVAIISWQAANVIDKMVGQLVSAYHGTIEGWASALEMRNQETEGHSQRVVALTMQLADRMHIPQSRCEHLQRGVLLHDIGKMGIPDAILCKQGPLTDAELKVMQKHPLYAKELLGHIAYLAPAIDIPYCHHEKWDGTGYPEGLHGDQIPREGRVLALADVYDALTSDRSYHKGMAFEKALDFIRQRSGTHFDPKMVEVFIGVQEENLKQL
jgi:HD-GYP domain-containing protein (c-di-GMP phosphodiesterase class II)